MKIIFINIICMLFFPLFFVGVINRVKACWAGRQGPSVFQPFYDFFKLMRKGEVISRTSSFVLNMGPSVILASVIFGALIIPMAMGKSIVSFEGDFMFFVYILGLSKLFMVLNALDTGSSFEGMGASREISFTALVEPAFFIILASMVYFTGQKSLIGILNSFDGMGKGYFLIALTVSVALFIMILVEGSRVPVDDPNTHLELTMIHEVMVLDNSGPNMGYVIYAAGLKMFLFSSIIAHFLMPHGLPVYYSVLFFCSIITLIAVAVGFVESLIARLRMTHVPEFVFMMTSFSFIVFAMIIINIFGGAR